MLVFYSINDLFISHFQVMEDDEKLLEFLEKLVSLPEVIPQTRD